MSHNVVCELELRAGADEIVFRIACFEINVAVEIVAEEAENKLICQNKCRHREQILFAGRYSVADAAKKAFCVFLEKVKTEINV